MKELLLSTATHAHISDAQINDAVTARLPWAIDVLRQLIAVDTIAPAEARGQELFAGILAAEGLDPQLLPIDEARVRASSGYIEDHLPLANRPNLLCNFGAGAADARTLVLNSHMDTESWAQEAAAWRSHPLTGEVRDGRVYGRGAVDAKGQLVAAVTALLALRDAGAALRGKVTLQSVVGEEPSGNGTLALCEAGVSADAAIVLEPTECNVAHAHRGILGLRYEVQGAITHAAYEDSGNAIAAAGALATMLDAALVSWSSPLDRDFGRPTMNVGVIRGGESIFSSPAHCVIDCGVRYAPGTADALLRHIEDYCRAEAARGASVRFEEVTQTLFQHFDASQTDPNHPFVSLLLSQARAHSHSPESAAMVFPGGCDARHLVNRRAIPTAIFGPGSLRQAHGVDEYLSVAQLTTASTILAKTILVWCS